jgi:hypothetical protein
MANTTNGLPYPLGTDKVVDGDNQIRALAEAVDTAVLPHGYARARCTTAAAHGPGAWNITQLDVLADARGAQPWTLDAANRRLRVTKAGVYLISATLTMNGTFALALATSMDGAAWDRFAIAPVGSVAYSNTVHATRDLAANAYLILMNYPPATAATVVDVVNSPSYLSIQALGGQ